MSLTDFPCGECGAKSGDPCADDCPVANMSFDEYEVRCDEFDIATGALLPVIPQSEVVGVDDLDEAAGALMAAVHRLPFGGLVGVRGMGAPDRRYYGHQEWLHKLAEWMAEYQEVLTAQVAKLSADSTRMISLEMERDMVRNYLKGVPV